MKSEEFTSIISILYENFAEVSFKEPILEYPKDIPEYQTVKEYYMIYQKDSQEPLIEPQAITPISLKDPSDSDSDYDDADIIFDCQYSDLNDPTYIPILTMYK